MAELCRLFVHVDCDRGSVLLRRRRNMLCTSGFVDDVIFLHNRLHGRHVYFEAARDDNVRHETTRSTVKHSSWILHHGAKSVMYDCLVFLCN